MKKRLNQFMLLLTVIAVVTASAISVTAAFADDGVTTGEPTEPAGGEAQPIIDEALPTEGEEVPPDEESAPAEGGEILPEEGTAPAETVEEILEQIPDGIEVVVLSEEGVEPLATEAAAQIIMEDDPMWCPGSHTPGDPECTVGDLNVADLITAIAALPVANRTGAGTIYFTANYSVDDATFDHDNPALSLITDLTIQGGWNGGTGGGFGLSGVTEFFDSVTGHGVPLAVTNWTGKVTLSDIWVHGVLIDSGVYVETSGDIELERVTSEENGFDGADLVNYEGTGDVLVIESVFSDNSGAGLYILSSGNVTLDNVTANGNENGDGATIDNTTGTGDVQVNNSLETGNYFNGNSRTGLSVESAGTITINAVTASDNYDAGVYLNALSGTGDIEINGGGGMFESNEDWGIKAFAGDGDITVWDVIEDGNDITANGAWLKSYNGSVFVNNSSFVENTDNGLLTVAGVGVELNNVTASDNGANGAEVYSIYNYACSGNKDITVDIAGGAYENNPGYGIYTEAGAAGTVTGIDTPTYSNNGTNYYINPFVNPCPKHEHNGGGKPGNPDDSKPLKIVEVPETGIDPEIQDCENYSGTLLELPSGTSVEVGCPFEGTSDLEVLPQDQLPGRLPNVFTFGSAIDVSLTGEGGSDPIMDEGGLLTLSFVIPEELIGKHLSILYWDPTANNGQGGWIELPLEQFGGASFPLHPQDPDDDRKICSGLEKKGSTVSVTVNFPGVFALVAR